MRAVCVIGLGLIGGSVLRAATAAGRPGWGATAGADDAVRAGDDGYEVTGIEDALRRAATEDALIVIATPVTAVRDVLRKIAWHAPEARLTDVISVKDAVDAEVRSLLPGARYAGGHPMAGTASSGWAAGGADLFRGSPWAVAVEEGTTLDAWRDAAALALDCGAHVVAVSAAEHDSAVARISHLPHVFANILAAVGADGGPLALSLAAGSFRDSTRVAASEPELVRAMTEGNRVALLDAVDDALGRLGAARGSLASSGALKTTVDGGHAARGELDRLSDGEWTRSTVPLRGDRDLRKLRDLGARGGRVTALTEKAAEVELPATE
ncbi:prephenate dehydrogenase [Saccharopolyspora gloriosae]|uniref:Prephenate dehydrogenase n=1 Tax=Saccharopolyspora gloriosae TaxID=455344 RepID=A0A840NR08_9PSEU|nr:prephenate dehydrogenase [Saccharopolyspora gloriosae]MBB5072405.1 prephenate dehydrogenase [Saccharopolyspora gloriosae]